MKDLLELKHLLAYVAHDVKIIWDDKSVYGITLRDETDYDKMLYPLDTLAYTIESQNAWEDGKELGWKLLLHPLDDYLDINSEAMSELGCDLSDQIDISELAEQRISLDQVRYSTYQIMVENHIDYQRLIDSGLALPIPTKP